MTQTKRKRGQPALPYKTKVMRVPLDLVPSVREQVSAYRKQKLELSKSVDMPCPYSQP